jgi:hypothetical protein
MNNCSVFILFSTECLLRFMHWCRNGRNTINLWKTTTNTLAYEQHPYSRNHSG